ncbi:hypothetical protein [Arthrobacter sp. NPDC057013]|uniref:hypothetical protein n=1 Tax=Arthrobacter sp. NPDC057013 TaxID=3345999 RepID=UPI003638DFF4
MARPAGRRGVPGQFRVELLHRGQAKGRQRVPQAPAELRVHSQSGHPRTAVQQAADQCRLAALGPADRGKRPGPGELLVRARLRSIQFPCRALGKGLPQRFALHGRNVLLNGQRGVAQDVQQYADAGLGGGEAEHSVYIPRSRRDAVAGRIPQRGPAQGAGHGVADPVQRGSDGALGDGVEPDLGVCQVLVIDQQQGRPGLPGELNYFLGPAGQVGLHGISAGQRAVVAEVVQPDPQPVGARLLPPGDGIGGVLQQGDPLEDGGAVGRLSGLQFGAQR